MTNRATKAQLENALGTLNVVFGYSTEPYQEERDSKGSLVANKGSFVLDYAYGGVRVAQMCYGGGQRDITQRGTKSETLANLRLMVNTAEMAFKAMSRG